jgi:hypothetical protein
MMGCPILRVFCEGWDAAAPSDSSVFALACLLVILSIASILV